MLKLSDQAAAALGPLPVSGLPLPSPSDAEPATRFRLRCMVAAVHAATQIGAEDPLTPDHLNRATLARDVCRNPQLWAIPFAVALASLGLDDSSDDAAIAPAVAGVWGAFAG